MRAYDPATLWDRTPAQASFERRIAAERRLAERPRDEHGRILSAVDPETPLWQLRRQARQRLQGRSGAAARPEPPVQERMVPAYDDFIRVDQNGDGQLDAGELRGAPAASLVRGARLPHFDRDGDGRLAPGEAIPGLVVVAPAPAPAPEEIGSPTFAGDLFGGRRAAPSAPAAPARSAEPARDRGGRRR